MRRPSPPIFIPVLSAACTGGSASGLKELLQRADRLARLGDWYNALPIYTEAEKAATKCNDAQNAMYAKFGCLRCEILTRHLLIVPRSVLVISTRPSRKTIPA
ncbi:MAG: hypothetical protein ACRD2X_20210 [Vicinamibacteraceae bacterium]